MVDGEDILGKTIADGQLQLKRMWTLRVQMDRIANAATVGASLGLIAAVASAGAIIWIVSSQQGLLQFEGGEHQLLAAIGLLVLVITMTGYLWWRRSVAISGALSLEFEMVALRQELQNATEVERRSSASVGVK